MKVKVVLKMNDRGTFFAQTLEEPDCLAEGHTREETLHNIKEEIRYRFEYCPCAFLQDHDIEIDLLDETR